MADDIMMDIMRLPSGVGRLASDMSRLSSEVVGLPRQGAPRNRFSLQFLEVKNERIFMLKRKDRMARGIRRYGAFMLGSSSLVLVKVSWEAVAGDQRRGASMVCFFAVAIMGMLSILSFMIAPIQQRYWVKSVIACEVASVLGCICLAILFCFTDADLVDIAMGIGDNHARDCDGCNWTMLGLATFSLAAHVVLPVRWCVLWPLEVISFLAYLVPELVVGTSRDADFVFDCIIFALLLALTGVAARSMEVNERDAFSERSALVAEKTLRVQAEFKYLQSQDDLQAFRGAFDQKKNILMEKRDSQKNSDGYDTPTGVSEIMDNLSSRTSVSSYPSTTATGKAFSDSSGSDAKAKLARIVRMGDSERWMLPSETVRIFPEDVMGAGGFGIVVRGELRGTEVAVKIPRLAARHDAVDRLPGLANELRILRHVKHPNIVLFFGAVVDIELGEIGLVLELVDGVTLSAYLSRVAPVPTIVERYRIIVGVCCALQFMHAQTPALIHGDIKSSNILVQEGGHAKLLDFGLSRAISRHMRPLGGTLGWMAPEVFSRAPKRKMPNTSADVFSFGCVVYFTATGTKTQHATSRHTMMDTIRAGRLPPLSWPEATPFILECKALVDKCTFVNALVRPKISDVLATLREWPRIVSGLHMCYRGWNSSFRISAEWKDGLPHARRVANHKERRKGSRRSADANSPPLPVTAEQVHWQFHAPNMALATVPEDLGQSDDVRGDAGDSAYASAPASPRAASVAALQKYKLTPLQTQRLMLADVMLRWYLGPPRCCALHAGIDNLHRLCRELKRAQCKQTLSPFDGPQCPNCGALYPDEDNGDLERLRECDVCGRAFTSGQLRYFEDAGDNGWGTGATSPAVHTTLSEGSSAWTSTTSPTPPTVYLVGGPREI